MNKPRIHSGDSGIFQNLGKVDWSEQEKVKKINRSVREIEQELYEKSEKRWLLPQKESKCRKKYLKDERIDAYWSFVWMTSAFAVLSSLIWFFTPTPFSGVLVFFLGITVLSLTLALWRGYVDLYFKARKEKKKFYREPISSVESVDYLMTLFLDTEKIEDQVKVFVFRLDDYSKLREEAREYLDNIDSAIKDATGKVGMEKVLVTLQAHRKEVVEKLRVVEEKELDAENFWHDLYKSLQKAKEDLKQLEEFRSKHFNSNKLGNTENLESHIWLEEGNISNKVISEVDSLFRKLLSAKDAVALVLAEKDRKKEIPVESKISEKSIKQLKQKQAEEETETIE